MAAVDFFNLENFLEIRKLSMKKREVSIYPMIRLSFCEGHFKSRIEVTKELNARLRFLEQFALVIGKAGS